jgi:hypothetical protein
METGPWIAVPVLRLEVEAVLDELVQPLHNEIICALCRR